METAKITAIELIDRARSVLQPQRLGEDNTAGDVACASLSNGGNLYLGDGRFLTLPFAADRSRRYR